MSRLRAAEVRRRLEEVGLPWPPSVREDDQIVAYREWRKPPAAYLESESCGWWFSAPGTGCLRVRPRWVRGSYSEAPLAQHLCDLAAYLGVAQELVFGAVFGRVSREEFEAELAMALLGTGSR